jgi:hypothetical protein
MNERLLNLFTKLCFYAFVIFSPINWVILVEVGGLSIKYMHLAIVPICICVLFASFRKVLTRFVLQNAFIISSFLLLMVINFVSICLNGTLYPSASAYIFKNLSYFTYFILFGAAIYFRIRQPFFYKEIAYSNIISVLVFTLTATIIFKAIGRDFLSDMFNFFIKGDSVSLRYDLFKTLFNTNSSSDVELAANLRNTLIGAFIYIHFTSLYSLKNSTKRFYSFCNWISVLFSLFFILASVSRSNLLVLMLGYVCYFFADILINKNYKSVYKMAGIAVIGSTLVIIFWNEIYASFSESTTMISSRLGELEDDARWALNAEAIDGFSQHFLIGKGSGAILSDGHTVHNFILGSAYQAGIGGLILSCMFYFGVIVQIIKNLKLFRDQRAVFFLLGLPIIPLLRSMESGNAGTISLIEWFCLAFFFALILLVREQKHDNGSADFLFTSH